jgi:signal peptidase I
MSEKNAACAEKNVPKGALHAILDYVEMFVFTVAAVILVLSFFFRLCVVSGPSMNNTLLNGEKLIVSDLFYTPDTGDIIVFHQTSDTNDKFNEPIVKRVIATEGEFVKIDYAQGKVFVSSDNVFTEDEVLQEDYIIKGKPNYLPHTQNVFVYEVPEGHLFVMGDNRPVSADSRYGAVDFVDERRVLGKVLFRVTPLNKFGKVG